MMRTNHIIKNYIKRGFSTLDIISNKNFKYGSIINGKIITNKNYDKNNLFDIYNPTTNELLISIPSLGAIETREAINKAYETFQGDWGKKTLIPERALLLRKWANLLRDNMDDLAKLITLENGKPLIESLGEINASAIAFDYFADQAQTSMEGDTIPSTISSRRLITIKQPIGVCALITPWNFPAAMLARKIGPAIAAGCTIIMKPAEDTPLTAIAMTQLGIEAGLPDGTINIITSSRDKANEVGKELCSNDLIKKISFTGSTNVGKLLMSQSSSNIKKVSLELGGNAPFIVFDDANIDNAVSEALISKFRNNGQTCVCANRFIIHENVYDEFVEKFTKKIQEYLIVGDGLDKKNTIGPLINIPSIEKIESMINDAIDKGANINLGGKRHKLGGLFFEPTILTNLNKDMRVWKEEIFGPIAPIFKFSSEDDIIQMGNDTEYGLAAYFCTENISRAFRIAEALDYGMVGINEGVISTEVAPFGGVKSSGIGREGSKYGMDEYMEMKYICFGQI